ncbi:hypothetical protein BpHYR1_048427 [Brachionus plicatilis]|uniref:Secreted protein n=1 Tax=Brachionus plicatilis TaxID=10195 RepID=A0A3M7SS26_BRAPC|nr:hypothetical protein BpHYR1_048427 [Brachionus plicatilis]
MEFLAIFSLTLIRFGAGSTLFSSSSLDLCLTLCCDGGSGGGGCFTNESRVLSMAWLTESMRFFLSASRSTLRVERLARVFMSEPMLCSSAFLPLSSSSLAHSASSSKQLAIDLCASALNCSCTFCTSTSFLSSSFSSNELDTREQLCSASSSSSSLSLSLAEPFSDTFSYD